MATIDEDLGQLEKDVRQLKIEYEQYFGGGRSRPPADLEWRIELVIKRYGERGSNMKFAQRYRYSGIAQTYARYKEVFRKRLREKEEGVVVRHFGAAAKAIEAERAARQPAQEPEEAGARSRARAGKTQGNGGMPQSTSDLTDTNDKSRKLYEAFRNAKQKAGEDTSNLTHEAFQKSLKRKAEEILAKSGGRKVVFAISTGGGRVKLKARVKPPDKSES